MPNVTQGAFGEWILIAFAVLAGLGAFFKLVGRFATQSGLEAVRQENQISLGAVRDRMDKMEKNLDAVTKDLIGIERRLQSATAEQTNKIFDRISVLQDSNNKAIQGLHGSVSEIKGLISAKNA